MGKLSTRGQCTNNQQDKLKALNKAIKLTQKYIAKFA